MFLDRLREAGVGGLADVRRFPASRRHPHFNRESLEHTLPAAGVAYRWFEALGGRRSATAESSSPNGGLRVAGFRAYADYALTPEFRAALDELVAWAGDLAVAVCCAEALWWQCHRRIIADHLVARGGRVIHLLHGGAEAPHELWDLARLTPDGPTYPPPQPELSLGGR
ncbi:MAG: DUF488 family protein [Gemmatimonadota bacterium]